MYSESTDILEYSSDDDYYLIDESEKLQQVLNETASDKTSVFTKEVNFSIKQFVRETQDRFRTSYSHQVYSERVTSSKQDYE